jgi:hypothetical protein
MEATTSFPMVTEDFETLWMTAFIFYGRSSTLSVLQLKNF